jgi:hypothetical protein
MRQLALILVLLTIVGICLTGSSLHARTCISGTIQTESISHHYQAKRPIWIKHIFHQQQRTNTSIIAHQPIAIGSVNTGRFHFAGIISWVVDKQLSSIFQPPRQHPFTF